MVEISQLLKARNEGKYSFILRSDTSILEVILLKDLIKSKIDSCLPAYRQYVDYGNYCVEGDIGGYYCYINFSLLAVAEALYHFTLNYGQVKYSYFKDVLPDYTDIEEEV